MTLNRDLALAFVDKIKNELGVEVMHRQAHFRSECLFQIQLKLKTCPEQSRRIKIQNGQYPTTPLSPGVTW